MFRWEPNRKVCSQTASQPNCPEAHIAFCSCVLRCVHRLSQPDCPKVHSILFLYSGGSQAARCVHRPRHRPCVPHPQSSTHLPATVRPAGTALPLRAGVADTKRPGGHQLCCGRSGVSNRWEGQGSARFRRQCQGRVSRLCGLKCVYYNVLLWALHKVWIKIVSLLASVVFLLVSWVWGLVSELGGEG